MYSPKGTTKMLHSKRGRGRTVASWRKDARWEAHRAMGRRKLMDGSVSVEVAFYLKRPPSNPGAMYPKTKPDLDKLQRALGDALEGVVMTQDSRIVHWSARKLYADDHPQGIPCAVVKVEELGES